MKKVLVFEIFYFESGVQILTKDSLKHLTRRYESIFEFTNFPIYNLVFLATSAAFLALMAFKSVNKVHQMVQLIWKNDKV